MNRKILRILTMVAMLSMPFSLVLSANAQVTADQLALDQGSARVDALAESPNGVYIVQMIGDPVVAYAGGIKGLKATKPRKGKKINPNSPQVIDYVAHLSARHEEALNKVGGGEKIYGYHFSFNGFFRFSL